MNYIKQLQGKIAEYEKLLVSPHNHNGLDSPSITTDPNINEKAISIIQQDDGNWIGSMQKFGKVVTARTNDPQTVLQALLTHNGQN